MQDRDSDDVPGTYVLDSRTSRRGDVWEDGAP